MNEWLLLQSAGMIYLALFLLLMGGAIGLPIPEDLPLILAGIVISHEAADPRLVFVVCYASILLSDLMIFGVGRYFGPRLFKTKRFRARFPLSKVRVLRLRLEKRSFFTILLARHLFYLRTVTFLTCGAVRMRLHKFLIADAAAALVSVPLMVGLGYLAAEHYDTVMEWVGRAKLLSAVIAVTVLVLLYRFFAHSPINPLSDEAEEELRAEEHARQLHPLPGQETAHSDLRNSEGDPR